MTSLPTSRALLNLEIAGLGNVRRAGLLVLAMLAAFTIGGMPSTLPLVTGILAVSISANAWTYDETYRLTMLYGSLPITRRDVVASHYRWAALLTLGAIGVTLPLAALSAALRPSLGSPVDAALAALLVMTGIALAPAVLMPVRLKFGPTAGLIVLVATVGVGTMAGVALGDLLHAGAASGLAASSGWAPVLGGVVLDLLAWAVSYRIAQRIYARKDF